MLMSDRRTFLKHVGQGTIAVSMGLNLPGKMLAEDSDFGNVQGTSNDSVDPMIISRRPALSPEERKLPLAKYYALPLYLPEPLQQQIIDAGPISPKYALKPENFLDLLHPYGYQKVEYGYCMMPDGTGYLAVYTTYPNCTPEMLAWWLRWLNVHTKGMPKDKGNLKYKLWNPADHYDHGFINGKDKSGGTYTVESFDLGQGEARHYSIRHAVNIKDFGFTDEREQILKAAGCFVDCSYETRHTMDPSHVQTPGTAFSITLSRLDSLGRMEKCSRVWIGYGVKDGKVIRDETTPASMLCEEYLRKILTHNTVEAQQLARILPKLYAEYKDKPDDED